MPYSVLLLDVHEHSISAELELPLKEFQFVFPDEDIEKNYQTLIQRKNKWLDDYLLSHIHISDTIGKAWTISIQHKTVREKEQNLTGKYQALVFDLLLQTPASASTRDFIMHYDAIMHQLVTHKLWIKVRSDWEGGLTKNDHKELDLGILGVNFTDNSIAPVVVHLDRGSSWKGFKAMVHLGIEHIAEGTDHLLFLLVLLLPATLLIEDKRWSTFAGSRQSFLKLIKLATAFTIGHSITLLIGALGWIHLPTQYVEIAIAFTILITAGHAIRPIFKHGEIYIVMMFGLMHGLAFASILSDLQLEGSSMAWSILGFNIGIELMQLFVILVTIPWLIVLSDKSIYQYLRIIGASAAMIAALGWMIERMTSEQNFITKSVELAAKQGQWFLAGLAILSITTFFTQRKKNEKVI